MRIIYSSDRKFVIVSYDASHGHLLLRSGKTNTLETRCDVMFHDVRAMEIRAFTEGLTITEVEPADLAEFRSLPLDLFEDGLTAYRLGNERWSGFVLGGMIRTAEDSRDFFDRSSLEISHESSS